MSKIGIIGGSGLYDIEGLEDKRWVRINTPFGRPSEKFLLAKLGDKDITSSNLSIALYILTSLTA